MRRMNVILIFVAFYLAPVALMRLHRTWLKGYLLIVFGGVLYLTFSTYHSLQAETDCRAGCALAIGAVTLVIILAIAGSALGLLSALALNKWRSKRNANG